MVLLENVKLYPIIYGLKTFLDCHDEFVIKVLVPLKMNLDLFESNKILTLFFF